MTKELEPCPFCGGEAEMYEGRYSADGRDDRPWMVQCQQCGVMVSRMPEYGEYNYWWLHTTEGEAHMREKIVKAWNTRYKRTCHDITPMLHDDVPFPDTFTCSECGAREDGVVKSEGMFCYNCGAMFDGRHIPNGAEVVDA